MEIGFLENVLERPDGLCEISGWTRARSVEIALCDRAFPDEVLLVLSVRPDRHRPDIPDVPAAGFQITLAPDVLQLLPRDVAVVPSAEGHPLRVLESCNPIVHGASETGEGLQRTLASGLRWNRKSGGLYLPIARWSEDKKAATLDLLEDVARASEHALSPAHGTLLGIVRSGRFLPHDDDVDMAAYVRAASLEEFVARWAVVVATAAQTLELDVIFPDDLFHPAIVRGEVGIDCWPVWVRDDGSFVDVHAAGHLDDFTLIESVLEGRTVRIPRAATRLLEHCYGPSYLVPDPAWRPERSFSDSDRYRQARVFRDSVNREMIRHVTVVRRGLPT